MMEYLALVPVFGLFAFCLYASHCFNRDVRERARKRKHAGSYAMGEKPIDLEEMEQRYADAVAAINRRVEIELKREREFWDDFARRHGITPKSGE